MRKPDATAAAERGGKKSAAYRLTTHHVLKQDRLGKQFEVRRCRFCISLFSFKGGTTSAALRHIKTAHPDRALLAGLAPPPAALPPPLETVDAPGEPPEEEPLAPPLEQQLEPASAQADDAPVAPADAPPAQADAPPAQADGPPIDEAARPVEEEGAPPVEEEGAPPVEEEATPPARADGPPVEEEDADASYYAQKERALRSILKRKRESESFDVDAAASAALARPLAPPASPSASSSPWPAPALRLTASQTAITHFLRHHKDELSVAARLRFAKHLTHNVAEAEMYNVLDDATRAAYIREFASPVSGNGRISAGAAAATGAPTF